MARRTRAEVWQELEALDEEEVRARLARKAIRSDEVRLAHEWLTYRARVAAALAPSRAPARPPFLWPIAAAPAQPPAESQETATPAAPDDEVARPRVNYRTVGTVGLFVLALLYTLYFARGFLLPITIAMLLNFLLSPVVRALKRLRVPEPLGAAVVVLGLLGLTVFAVYEGAGPARQWVAKGPESLRQAQSKLHAIRRPMEQVTRTAEQVERATNAAPSSDSGQTKPTEVVVRGPSLGAKLFGVTQSILTAFLGIVILLYFLLAAGNLFLLKLVRVLPQFGDKRRAVSIVAATESSISTYLVTVALVNAGQGIVVGFVMWLLGLPNPALWAVLATFAEFIPYLGALTMIVVLGLAGLVTFDHVAHALLAPGAYLVINLLQANVVTPMVLGHRLALNPVAIFIGLAFWLWVWGIPGAFIAVPMLATLKICCDHIDVLAPVGEFLGD